ncbi:MAG TPA: YoaK family protein [Streptosporangiaceae bacterium]|nr:YoaK family protein [Streptosporangiaceae bacterium]
MKRSWQGGARDGLLVLLTLTTGAVDASCFLHLGNVFSSVITGNLVLLGVAVATQSGSLAIHSGTALAGYAAGVLIGAPIATRRGSGGETWPPSVTATLVAEFCVLAGFSVGWELTGGSPGGTARLLLIAGLAMAMGIQSAAVRELGGMSTTYLTGTLTAVIAELATRDRKPGLARSVGVLVAIVSGAVAGGLVAGHAPAWLPAVILAPLAGVVIASVTLEAVKPASGPRRDR